MYVWVDMCVGVCVWGCMCVGLCGVEACVMWFM